MWYEYYSATGFITAKNYIYSYFLNIVIRDKGPRPQSTLYPANKQLVARIANYAL